MVTAISHQISPLPPCIAAQRLMILTRGTRAGCMPEPLRWRDAPPLRAYYCSFQPSTVAHPDVELNPRARTIATFCLG
ncbi:hypothetical protein FA95DRAFT_1553049 [Auriscalpium vulgare]|uniref:Uncharacterized protein n=1 Tax=Auriscalpium vulgare TaxID=40419 RepID=A0ACB8SA42_9AGAM|nr:hypothetical protein FA95DRAFT_1553049 [Auriscalpium vulgare]